MLFPFPLLEIPSVLSSLATFASLIWFCFDWSLSFALRFPPPTSTHTHIYIYTGLVRWKYVCPDGVPVTSPEIQQGDFSQFSRKPAPMSVLLLRLFPLEKDRFLFCFILFYFIFSCGEASFAPWWKGRASPEVTWRNDRWVYMTLSLSPRSEPEGMPWIGTVNATRGGNRIRTWVWIRKEQLLDPPGTPGVDSSSSTVGKAADGDLPLHNH